jgi:hypothetical protein
MNQRQNMKGSKIIESGVITSFFTIKQVWWIAE